MESLTTAQIQQAFVNCSKRAAAAISVPPLDDVAWPDLDFFAWRNPRMPERAYLAAWIGDELVAIELRSGSGRKVAAVRSSMCDFCHTVHSAGAVRLFAAAKAGQAGRRGDTVGAYICTDLACSAYIRGTKRPGRIQPVSTMTTQERADRVSKALNGFVERILDRTVSGTV